MASGKSISAHAADHALTLLRIHQAENISGTGTV
jgi:hypothetical protein